MSTASKHGTIVDNLRTRIVSGDIRPGSRLPTRAELVRRFDVSPLTMQRAFDELISDGFVETRGKAGTFVSEHSPHLTHYAIVIHRQVNFSLFYHAIAMQQPALELAGRRISTYVNVGEDHNSPDYRRLLADIKAHRIAGIIFTNHPYHLNGTPILTEPGIPRCAFMTAAQYAHISALYGDYGSFIGRALDFLIERGRSKVAFLIHRVPVPPGTPSTPSKLPCDVPQAMAARGLRSPRAWTQYPDFRSVDCVKHAVYGILERPESERPDSLVILDDNLVPAATQAIADTALTPEALDVVAFTNFPQLPSCYFPATHLGFNIEAQLQCCFANIDAQRRGEPVAPLTTFPAVFQHELGADPQPQPIAVES